MVDVLDLVGMATMSVVHTLCFGRNIVTVSNVNLVKYRNCSDANVLTYVSVKYYSFRSSATRPYASTFIRLYGIPFWH